MKLLLVDSSSGFLRALASYLEMQPDLQIVGLAHTAEEAVSCARSGSAPDLVLMDISSPAADGLAEMRHLKAELPGTAVIILSLRDGAAYREAARTYGADGFVSKAALSRDLLPAIRSVGTR